VCRNDSRVHPFVLEVYESRGTHYGLAVEDAIHCGVCKPKPDPVRMDFLDEAATAPPATAPPPASAAPAGPSAPKRKPPKG
jgi:hypothetical protein